MCYITFFKQDAPKMVSLSWKQSLNVLRARGLLSDWSYTQGCHPGNSRHRFFGSLASCIILFTWPLTLNEIPSSTPLSFCPSLNRTLSAILFASASFLSCPFNSAPPSMKSWSPAVLVLISDASGSARSLRCCNSMAFAGDIVQT